ncbi:SH3 domain-containing protein [Alkalihalobacillus sp. NPDC078783]
MNLEEYKNINDSFAGIREQMQQINRLTSGIDFSPMLKAHREMQTIGFTASRMVEQMRMPLIELHRNMQISGALDAVNQLKRIQLPIINIQDTIRLSGISESISSINRLSGIVHTSYFTDISKLTKAMSQIHSNLDLSSIRHSISTINSITMPVVELSKQIQSMSLANYNLNTLIPDISHVLESIREKSINISSVDISSITEKLNVISFEEISVEEDGTINYQNEWFTREEVQEIVNKAINDSCLLLQQESKDINVVIAEIQKHKQPLYQQILLNLICGVILFLATPLMQTVQDSITTIMIENKTKIIKLIKEEYQSLKLEVSEQNHIRLVKTESMFVRITNKKNAQPVGKVNFGMVVQVLYKNKNWSLIEYENENEEIVTGWVYTRYLEKLNK